MCLIKQVLCLIYGSRCIIARNMSMSENPTTPTQSRTRQAILEAAVQVLIRDRSAPLSDVAKRADVARSTLHRYFPERADLIAAVDAYTQQQIGEIAERCSLDNTNVIESMVRLALEYFERWDAIMWGYSDAWESSDEPPEDDLDIELGKMIEQGQADGVIDATMPSDWFQHAMYAIVYSAWEYERNGHAHAEAAMMVMVSMRKLLAPPVR